MPKQRTCKNYFYDLPVELQVYILNQIPKLRSHAVKAAGKAYDRTISTCVPKKPKDPAMDASRHPENNVSTI